MRNRWRVQPQQCGCDSLSIASERGERRPERKLVMRTLFDKLLTLTSIRWQRVLEDFRVMVTILKKMVLLTLDGYTKEVCIAGYLFCKKVRHLVKGSGLLFTALYLKQCSSSLQIWPLEEIS